MRAVEGFLGGSSFLDREQQLVVDVRVLGDEKAGYVAKLTFRSAEGVTERVIEDPDCKKLAEAAALLAALAIDPERVKAVQEQPKEPAAVEPAPLPPPAPAPVVVPPAIAPQRDAPSPAPQVDASQRARFTVGLAGLLADGSLPNASAGVGADFALRWRKLELGIGARYFASQNAAIPGTTTGSVELSLTTAALRLCLVPEHGPWSLALCGRVDAGAMSGSGDGIEQARTRRDFYSAIGGGAVASYSLGRVSPLVGVEALGLAARPRFGILRDGIEQEVFRPEAWQLTAFLGISYTL